MKVERLIVEITTSCNFSCFFCPVHSSEYNNNSKIMSFSSFKRLVNLYAHIKSLVFSGFGEPLLNPEILDMVQFAKKQMASSSVIAIQTNGALLSEAYAVKLVEAGVGKFCISIDTFKDSPGHSGEYALNALGVLKNLKKTKDFLIGIETVITKDNIEELPDLINRVFSYNIDFVLISHLIPYSKDIALKVLYDTNNIDSVNIYNKWLNVLYEKGYTIEDWFDIAKKMAGEGVEYNEEVYKLYKGMYDEAQSYGLTLNLTKLVKIDDVTIKRTEEVLNDIRKICEAKGVYYKIPGVHPKSKRSCEFIEEKCLFVSVDGEVTPCYFLWHSFSCYIAQLKKSVKRLSFGNVNEVSPVEICESSNYKKFREAVLKYEFPYCYDCNFALCDLMELKNFVHDCYSNEIPCGACLWCGGLFYCMI